MKQYIIAIAYKLYLNYIVIENLKLPFKLTIGANNWLVLEADFVGKHNNRMKEARLLATLLPVFD